MASAVISSFFTRGGSPATDLETASGGGYPLLRIWEIIDGTPGGSTFIGTFLMIPVEDGVEDDGFYKYEFTDVGDGYDPSKIYTFRVDGGPSLPLGERYQVARLDPTDSIDATFIEDAVWDANRAAHLNLGSTGEGLSQIKADTADVLDKLYLDADSVLEVVQLLLKMETGRTRIDPSTNTLTIYEEDCTTILRQYKLYDSTGTESVTDVCERKPVVKGASDTTTITGVCP